MRRSLLALAAVAVAVAALYFWNESRRDPWQKLIEEGVGQVSPWRIAAESRVRRGGILRSGAARVEGPKSKEVYALAAAVLSTSSDEHQRAIAAFLIGRTADAERSLTHLAHSRGSPAAWNDLAVVLAAKSAGTKDDSLISALAAADRAIDLDPSLHAARFNRALIIEHLGLLDLARDAYEEYSKIDGTSEWGSRARERMRAIDATPRLGAAWREVLPSIVSLAAQGEISRIGAATAESPQEAKTYVLSDLLPQWGEARQRGDRESAVLLSAARTIGQAIRASNGDATVADAVAAIDAAADDPVRVRTLAAGHETYGRAHRLYGERRIADAAPLYESARASFEKGGSPAVLTAAYYCASTDVDVGNFARALARLRELDAAVPDRYPSLRAHIEMRRGTALAFDGFVGEALESYRRAHSVFLRIRETRTAVDLGGRIAAALGVLGRPGEAWPIHRQSLAAAGKSGSSRIIQTVLHSAMYVAVEEQRWDLAHALLNLEVEVEDANPRVYAEAVVWRALTAHRAQMRRTASADFRDTGRALNAIADPGFRESAENDLRLVEALLVQEQFPEKARALLTEFMAGASEQHRVTRMPQILVSRARILRRLGLQDDAERDLREAVRLVEERHERVDREILRDAFLGKSSSVYLELADLLDRRGDVSGSLEAADLARARLLIDRSSGGVFDAERLVLEPGVALLSYAAFDDRAVIHAVTHAGLRRFTSPATTERLKNAADAFLSAIANRQDAVVRREGKALYALLVEPVLASLSGVEKIVVIADAPVDRLPFSALVQPDGRFLIESFEITRAPGVQAYALERTPGSRRPLGFAAIGNPTLDRSRHPDLPALRGAAEEAAAAARMYRHGELVLGEEATKQRVVDLLETSEVVHFATHATADLISPEKSRLILSDGDLTAAEIAETKLGGVRTVVLAGCRTGAAGQSYGFMQNLAAAFLAGGARSVVGSLWDIEDAATASFSVAFHRALAAGAEPARAMREAQRAMIGGGVVEDWAGLQVYEVRE